MRLLKNLIIILSFCLSAECFSLEIQCQTQWDDLLMVVRKSPSSFRTYLLFLNEDEVEKYWILPEVSIEHSQLEFSFKDNDTEIVIDLVNNQGVIKSEGTLLRAEDSVILSSCKSF